MADLDNLPPVPEPSFLEDIDINVGLKDTPPALPDPVLTGEQEEWVERPSRSRSLRMQYRFWKTIIFFALIFARLLFWHWLLRRIFGAAFVERNDRQRWRAYSRDFRNLAIEMGGVMIKMGQFVSTRVDVLPEEITAELEGLQDEVPTVPFSEIREVIERELGPISSRYSWIDEVPVAAASLGQVHRAKLLNGDRVVVKVQRPGIGEIVNTDLAAMKVVARYAMKYPPIARRIDTNMLIQEFGRVLIEELSYRQEAQNAARFAKMFANDMGVYIPTMYTEHCTNHILTIEDVTSIKLNDYAALEAAGISRKTVADRLMNTYLRQIFEERFFHADPHPGNLFIYPLPVEEGQTFGPEGRPFYLIFIDFGMIGILTEKVSKGLVSTMLAVATRDAKKLIESYGELGLLMPGADRERLEEATRAVFDQVWGLNMSEIGNMDYNEMANIADEFNDLLHTMPFQMPQDFVYLGRAVGILSGMCTGLDPTYDPWREMQPWTQKLLAQGLGGSASGSGMSTIMGGATNALGLPDLASLFSGNGMQMLMESGRTLVTRAIALPNRAENVLDRLERGDLKLKMDATPQMQRQLDRIEAQTRNSTRAMIFAGVLVASTILYTNGDIVLALGGFIFSAVLLLLITFRSGG